MQKSALLAVLQQEIRRHDFSHFVDEPPSVAQGGHGVVVSGCPTCRNRINTTPQFPDHLADNVLPPWRSLSRTTSRGAPSLASIKLVTASEAVAGSLIMLASLTRSSV